MIHRFAHLDDTARVAENATIWQFASIIRNAHIGHETRVGAGAIIDGAYVGDRCSIGSLVNLNPGTFVADDCFIGPGVLTCNDPWPKVDEGDFSLAVLLSGDRVVVHVEARASVGAGAILLPGVSIGVEAMVAAGAVVGKPVPARHLYKRSGDMVPIEHRDLVRSVHVAYLHDAVGRER